MPAEDRDRLFESALARHLRADAAASESVCPDTEILAAYHERMLSPEEMIVAKNHLVSCLRCQEILAQLETTQSIQDLQNNEADLVAGVGSGSNATQIVEEASNVPAATPVAHEPTSKIANVPARKNMLLRWAAPAGAIAAGLLLWIGVREFRTQPKSVMDSTQIADNRARSPRSLDVAPATPQPAENEKPELSRDEAYMTQPVTPPAAGPRDELKASRSAGSLGDRLRADKKTPSPAPMVTSKVSSAPSPATGADAGTAGGNIVAKTDQVQASSQTVEVEPEQSQLVVQQNDIKQQASGAARPAAPPPPAPAASKARREIAVTAEAAGPMVESKDANQPAVLRKAFYDPSALTSGVMAPDGKSLWRFGVGGTIAHSSDTGQTWQPQVSGVTATLTNGSAPSEKVCWIAGTAGTLLLTKDGGKHWRVITTPIAGDLGGVRATDAKHASIWEVPNHVSFETSDGGATWKQTANE
jgi:hypothetical protein